MKSNKLKDKAYAKKVNVENVRYKNMKAKRDKKKKQIATVSIVAALVFISVLCLMINNIQKENREGNDMSFNQFDEPQTGDYVATINTTLGNIKFRLFSNKAPKAVENFVTHAQDGYYNDTIFHRIIENFMIQGGDPTGTGYYGESIFGKDFEDELTSDLSLFTGALAMANHGANTNASQFFIVQAGEVDEGLLSQMKNIGVPNDIIESYKEHGGTPHLDYRFTANRHTVFGQVIDGMDVVNQMAKVETNEADKPLEDIKIIDIKIEKIEE